MIDEESEQRRCRFCRSKLEDTFADLGASPLANAYLRPADLKKAEPFYPLNVFVCPSCFLVQLEELSSPEAIFSDYAYFSSYSESWLEHSRRFVENAIEKFNLNESSRVVEIGSNDGYLLRFFKEKQIGVLGVEPAANVAEAAQAAGIETVVRFFDCNLAAELADSGRQADLIVGNNVIAHIPHTNNLLQGLKRLLKPTGVISMEFPHLLKLIEENQFDTIYHEHFSYFSATTAATIFAAHDLPLFDVEELPTHGGSLRIYAGHREGRGAVQSGRLTALLQREEDKGLKELETYRAFNRRVKAVKREILRNLIDLKDKGKRIAGYGAPAKGNTLLNYCGIGTDFLDYTVDLSPHKQGTYLPGSRLPVYSPDHIIKDQPDYLLILPWNLKEEIAGQMSGIREWGGQFITLIPEVEIF